ncbi:hypothetical protein GCM10009864_21320 [Streptomyces lunalinharesii]|uniref:Uncharacterized protein n=1 Tax=Streptomyces lunalinharesii TaxID=333384 RepID=A0ABP6DY15_9ACTN
MTVPSGCCSSQVLRNAAVTERDAEPSSGKRDESMSRSVAMGSVLRYGAGRDRPIVEFRMSLFIAQELTFPQ